MKNKTRVKKNGCANDLLNGQKGFFMKGYKGFEKGLVCRGKQYAENAVFEEDNAVICESGMHYCENPLDVLDYYPLLNDVAELNEFCAVEALDEPVTDDNKKFATKKLKIGLKLSFSAFIKAAIDFVFEKTQEDNDSGNYAKLASSGIFAQLASSGIFAQLASSGNSAQLASSGDSAKLAASGDSAKLAASGDYAKLAASGKNSVVCGIGNNNIAKAARGSWITLAEYDEHGIVKLVKTRKVDGKHVKANTWYKLENGKFTEVQKKCFGLG